MGGTLKRAVILGASGGIGGALAAAVRADEVLTFSRRAGDFDLTDEPSIQALAQRVGAADFIFLATGGLELDGIAPEKTMRALGPENMARHYAVNAIGPALVLKHFAPLLPRDEAATIAVLSARVGSISDNRLGGWVSYRAAKAALNQIVKCAAIELSRTHKQSLCVGIHPGTVATELTRKYAGGHKTVEPETAAKNILTVLGGLSHEQTGLFFDWKGAEVLP